MNGLKMGACFKGALSGLRQILATASSLKMMKNAFYFTLLKTTFVLKILQFLFRIFGHVTKRLDKKAKVNCKIYDVTNCITNKYNTHFAKCLMK